MAEEQLYTVEGAEATPAERVRLTEAGLLERQHLQEWVIAHPEILGEDVLIITFEFDRWITGAGAPTWERLDVLALDRAGRLIVAELKRDVAPDAVMVQALNYAAMARGFSLDLLVEAYGARRDGELSVAELQEELREWAPAVSDDPRTSENRACGGGLRAGPPEHGHVPDRTGLGPPARAGAALPDDERDARAHRLPTPAGAGHGGVHGAPAVRRIDPACCPGRRCAPGLDP